MFISEAEATSSIEQLTRSCIPVGHAEVLLTFQDIFSYSGAHIPEVKAKISASLEDKDISGHTYRQKR